MVLGLVRMHSEKLQLAASGSDDGVYFMVFRWNWPTMRGMDPDAEFQLRVSVLHPLISAIRASHPRAYVLTNDEAFVPNVPHRHMEDMAGNLDEQILQDHEHRTVPFEFCWGKLELGSNRWSYLLKLDHLPLERFDRELLGMTPNPICYNFIFTEYSVSLDQLAEAMAIPGNDVGNPAKVWERKLLDRAGFLGFPKEESMLVFRSKDSLAIETLQRTKPWLRLSASPPAENLDDHRV
jgi:hypothetical protein